MTEWVMTEIVEAPEPPRIDHIVTEDDTPVDNLFSAKLQRLLVQSLYLSYATGDSFLADANVGIFRSPNLPAIVPDVFLSLDVALAEDWYAKEHRTYFVWEFGKPPDVVIEIVSNNKEGETNRKLREYALLGVWYYAIYDPQLLLQATPLVIYELTPAGYRVRDSSFLDGVRLGLTVWHGSFETKEADWLRWYGEDGELLLTGEEHIELEQQRIAKEHQRAEQERGRAERLLAQLRALGIEPEA